MVLPSSRSLRQSPPDLKALAGFAQVVTGKGCAAILPKWIGALADRPTVALVTGARTDARVGAAKACMQHLAETTDVLHLRVDSEPSDKWVDDARRAVAKAGGATCVVSLGGGSALDAGKALAALLCETAPTIEYLEGVGSRTPSGAMLPWFAVPTTAGTGSEASTNAVLSRPGPGGFKKSLRHPAYRPVGVILDPKMTATCSPQTTAACGMDAFTQLFEAWSSIKVTADLEGPLENALVAVYQYLPSVIADPAGSPWVAREALLAAAFLSGLGLARAGLGTAHGLAGPIGAILPMPHGLICARLTGPCLRETEKWLTENPNAPNTLAARKKLARLREGLRPFSPAGRDPLTDIQTWADRWNLPRLSTLGLTPKHHPAILAAATDRNSPASLGPATWKTILREA